MQVGHKSKMRDLIKRHAEDALSRKQQVKELKSALNNAYDMLEGLNKLWMDDTKSTAQCMEDMLQAEASAKGLAKSRLEKLKALKTKNEQLNADLDHEAIDRFELKDRIAEYKRQIAEMTKDYQNTVDKLTPERIKKTWVKNEGKKGGTEQWNFTVEALILEALANRTPPSCIQANILAFARTILPHEDIVDSIPSVRHIQGDRSLLLYVTKTLAAYQLGSIDKWVQIFYDDTSRRTVSLTAIGVGILDENEKFKTVCLTSSIISKNTTAECQSNAVIASFSEGGQLLEEWREQTKKMYPDNTELVDMIPDASKMSVVKAIGGMVETDTCNQAQKSNRLTRERIISIAKDHGIPEDGFVMYEGFCMHHVRNLISGNTFDEAFKTLTQLLIDDLALIPPQF